MPSLSIRARDINVGLGLTCTVKYALETLGAPSTVSEKIAEILTQRNLKLTDLSDAATVRGINKQVGGGDWAAVLSRLGVDDAVIIVTVNKSMTELMASASAALKKRKVQLLGAVGHPTARTPLNGEIARALKDVLGGGIR